MGAKGRELIFEPEAVEQLHQLNASDEELVRLIATLQELKRSPTQGVLVMGNPHLYIKESFYILDIGKFVVHYTFDETRVQIGWIGIY